MMERDYILDKYQRVEKKREDAQIQPNEIRITALGRRKNYISYALNLLDPQTEEGATGQAIQKHDTILLKAMGRAITKTVAIAEIIKRRIEGLHQLTEIESSEITDVWEPLEEGLKIVETVRRVSSMTLILSKKQLDVSAPGYQQPLPLEEVRPERRVENVPRVRRGRGRRGRGRGRGGFQDQFDDNNDQGNSRGGHQGSRPGGQRPDDSGPQQGRGGQRRNFRGRGRGRRRGRGRGRGRGGRM